MTDERDRLRLEAHNRIIAVEYRLLNARRCWGAVERISERSQAINSTMHRHALGHIQQTYRDMAIVQVSALYDEKKNNKSHSLPHLAGYLSQLPTNEPLHFWKNFHQQFDPRPSTPLHGFLTFVQRYKEKPLSEALAGVRTSRDKHLAHYDANPAPHDLTYMHVDLLLEHCRIALRMASTCFAGRIAGPDEELLSHLGLDKRTDIKRVISALIGD